MSSLSLEPLNLLTLEGMKEESPDINCSLHRVSLPKNLNEVIQNKRMQLLKMIFASPEVVEEEKIRNKTVWDDCQNCIEITLAKYRYAFFFFFISNF